MSGAYTFSFDFNAVRTALVRTVALVCGIPNSQVVLEQPETQNVPRPQKPYVSFRFTSPAIKSGDDSKEQVKDNSGNPTSVWNSGGVRKMPVQFDTYGNTHEEAYNLMARLESGLDLEDVQEILRESGIAVWLIGNVADLTQLLNTGFEGRATMDVQFGIAVNMQSDLSYIRVVEVDGAINIDSKVVHTTETIGE